MIQSHTLRIPISFNKQLCELNDLVWLTCYISCRFRLIVIGVASSYRTSYTVEMAKSTTNYEVVIGTGNNDSDSAVEVRLINAKGECSAYKKPAEYGPPGRDNYEKGSIEICTGIPYELAGDPVKVDIKFAGKKWYLGGIWVTNQTTGNAWYFRDGKLITERYTTIDLTSVSKESDKKQSDQQHSDKLYDKFSCRIITGSDGTDNKVSD